MAGKSPIVYVVDDEPSICVATSRLLRSAGYTVKTLQTTKNLFDDGRPDGPCCLVLDLRIPDETGLQFQQRLSIRGIHLPIIFVSGNCDVPSSVQAMKQGAADFLQKPYKDTHLLAAVANALDADEHKIHATEHLIEMRARYATLTPRERDVFAAVATGLLNKLVADELGIAEKTVKVHRARVMEKMQARSIADLVRMSDQLHLRWDSPETSSTYSNLVG